MDEEFSFPPELGAMFENMQKQIFEVIAPALRTNIRRVLERNDALVNQDSVALDFLTEEIVKSLMEPPR